MNISVSRLCDHMSVPRALLAKKDMLYVTLVFQWRICFSFSVKFSGIQLKCVNFNAH